jgi:hypothetical protein
MYLKRGLFALCCSLAASVLPAHAGETSSALNMSLTIRASCEVSSRVDDGRYQVQDRGCAGAAAYKVESDTNDARLLSAQVGSSDTQASSSKIVTIYW